MLCVLVSEATGYPSKTLATLLNADWEERIVRPNSAAVRPSLGYCAKNALESFWRAMRSAARAVING